jgi:hypothetical protein
MIPMIRRTLLFAMIPLGCLTVGRAEAASQTLGLVVSVRPSQMNCDAEGCRTELSSFCLQQARPDPRLGTIYRPAPGAALTLIVTGSSGQVRRLDGRRFLSFVANRGFTSVTATLPPDVVAGLDTTSLAVEVGKDASLLPEAKVGDDNPQSEDELALATGANRMKAEAFFDQPGQAADAIRLTNAMINDLPAHGRANTDTNGALLSQVEEQYRNAPVNPAGVRLAEQIHARCVVRVDVTHHVDSMRDCLEGSHDVLVSHTNIDFWRSLGGS